MTASSNEKILEIDGQVYAYKEYHPHAKKKLVALHGWLDNAASFDVLAPYLTDFHVICLDLPGHGLSDHAASGRGYVFSDWVVCLAKFIQSLGLGEDLYLLGHSMGAGVCSLYAGLQLQTPKKIFLVDGLVPVSTMQGDVVTRLSHYIKFSTRNKKKKRIFNSIHDAFEARKIATPSMPQSAVEAVMTRQLSPVNSGAYELRSDDRLNAPSAMLFSHQELTELVQGIHCEVVFFRADDAHYESYRQQAQPYLDMVENLTTIPISGSHYIHFEFPEKIAKSIF